MIKSKMKVLDLFTKLVNLYSSFIKVTDKAIRTV